MTTVTLDYKPLPLMSPSTCPAPAVLRRGRRARPGVLRGHDLPRAPDRADQARPEARSTAHQPPDDLLSLQPGRPQLGLGPLRGAEQAGRHGVLRHEDHRQPDAADLLRRDPAGHARPVGPALRAVLLRRVRRGDLPRLGLRHPRHRALEDLRPDVLPPHGPGPRHPRRHRGAVGLLRQAPRAPDRRGRVPGGGPGGEGPRRRLAAHRGQAPHAGAPARRRPEGHPGARPRVQHHAGRAVPQARVRLPAGGQRVSATASPRSGS
jgi:hypothetical protein